jgi:hypothetical protein
MLRYGLYSGVAMIVPEKCPCKLKWEFRSGIDKLTSPWDRLVIGIIALAQLKETSHEL